MAFLEIPNVKIAGVAAAVPKNIKDIKKQKCFVGGESEAEKVIALTGVQQSRIAPEGMCCSDLCCAAAEQLLKDLRWDRAEVEALIYVSVSRDYTVPMTATLLQDRLHLSKECFAIDIPLACSGYVYGLSTIASIMQGGGIKKALLLVGETTSAVQSPLDKTVWPLHGDAGTATALVYEEGATELKFHLATDGSRGMAIVHPHGGTRYPITDESLVMEEIEQGVVRNKTHCILDGMNVFSFSLSEPPKSIKKLSEHFGIDLQNIDYLLLHQANKYMDDKILKRLQIQKEKSPYCMQNFGNTSSATIPMTMVTAMGQEIFKNKLKIIMCGFGAGLSWASAYVELDHIMVSKLIELD